MTGQLAPTPREAARFAGGDGAATLRYVVIVARDRPDLFDELSDRFRHSTDTTVVMEQQSHEVGPVDYERRRALEARLWVDGYVIVRQD